MSDEKVRKVLKKETAEKFLEDEAGGH